MRPMSRGHLLFEAESEVFVYVGSDGSETILRAPIKNGFDPDGYRLGGVTDSYTRSVTPTQFIADVQKLSDEYKDGWYYNECIDPEDKDKFTPPSTTPEFLEFYLNMQRVPNLKVTPKLENGVVRMFMKDEFFKIAMSFLIPVTGCSFHSSAFIEDYSEITFPESSLPEANNLFQSLRPNIGAEVVDGAGQA